MGTRTWTDEELAILEKNCGLPRIELRKLLPGKTRIQISNRLHRKEYSGKYSLFVLWSKEESAIIEEHCNLPKSELMKLLPGKTSEQIRARIRSQNPVNYNKGVRLDWTDEEAKILVDNINLPRYKLRELLPNRTGNQIASRIGWLGLKMESGRDGKHKYTFNENFFSAFTNESCCVAGFIAGDGCICNDRLVISLNGKDTTYLESVKNALSYTGSVLKYPDRGIQKDGNGTCRLGIYYLGRALLDLTNNFSITPRKSLTLNRPRMTDMIHKLCFISGLIDADGCLGIYPKSKLFPNKGVYASLNIIGSKNIIDFVNETFEELIRSPKGVHPFKKENYYSLSVAGKRAEELIKIMLQLSVPIRLGRKWDKFKYLLDGLYLYNGTYKIS